MSRNQENIIVDLCLLVLIALFIGATCKASQNIESHDTIQEESK
mgnify:CR=1 FL=1